MARSEETIATLDEAPAAGSHAVGVPTVSVEEFERAAVDLGLVEAGEIAAFREGLAGGGGGGAVAAEALARALVRAGRLTRYQASALFQGKARALAIGPYLVLDKLGSGGMGMVFQARAREGGPEVALKLLPPSASRQAQAVERFRREARIMERLDHPNIVASHRIGEYGGVHYLVMDYVEGRDLDRLVRSGGPLKVARAVALVLQAADGLAAAHARGIVHRDIKPANLLVDARGVVRVLDLGLARITHADDPLHAPGPGPSLTRSGMIMGTVDYLPPEQSDDSKRADHRADIYALGCTLHYLLTGRPPFAGDSIMRRLLAHHQDPVPSLAEARPDVPPGLDAVFRRMLAKDPEARPQSMAEVIEALQAVRPAAPGARGLRVFDDAPPTTTAPEPAPASLDLMTFVRTELLSPDDGPGPAKAPAIPRRARRARRGWAIPLALGGSAVALATLGAVVGVLISRSLTVEPKAATAPAPAPARPAASEVPVTAVPPKPEPIAPESPKVATPEPARPVAGTGSAVSDDRPPPPPPRGMPGFGDFLRSLTPPPPRPGEPGFGPPPDGRGRPPRPGDPGMPPGPGRPGDPFNRPPPRG